MDRIYIIESPSAEDLRENRKEGDALFHALKLSDMDVSYQLAINEEAFRKALNFIVEDFYNKKGKLHAMPYIHISAHGDEDGIELSDGEYFDWCDFEECLSNINKKIGNVMLGPGLPSTVSRITLCFSACKGYNSFKIHTENTVCPFQATIGPTDDIEWADSLTAFITFYHQTNYKRNTADKAVKVMNISADLKGVFKIYVSPEVDKAGKANKALNTDSAKNAAPVS